MDFVFVINSNGYVFIDKKYNYKTILILNYKKLGFSEKEYEFARNYLSSELVSYLFLIRNNIVGKFENDEYYISVLDLDYANTKDLIFNLSILIVGGIDNANKEEANKNFIIYEFKNNKQIKIKVKDIYEKDILYKKI